jgi:RNA-directed DNA polymerase
MKISDEYKTKIRKDFCKIESKDDLLQLINFCKVLLYGEKTNPFTLRLLTYYSNPTVAKSRYVKFEIKKKSGAPRIINAPVKGLKHIQRCLNLILNTVFTPSNAATGFIPGKSIVDNSKAHINKSFVYNIDLKDFFHSIELHRVKAVLKLDPFNLKNDKEYLAFLIANLCCTEIDHKEDNITKSPKKRIAVLPQGAPTSPTITNIVSQKLDRRLTGLSKRFNCSYTRYADDITFSANYDAFKNRGDFRKELKRIIENEGFTLNKEKERKQYKSYKQEVTGLIVNEKVNLHRRYIKKVRMWIYYWEKYDYTKASLIFEKDYKKDKPNNHQIPSLSLVLMGKLYFIKMVKGPADPTYISLNNRFHKLVDKNSCTPKEKIDFNEIVEILLKEGVEKAMSIYVKRKQN